MKALLILSALFTFVAPVRAEKTIPLEEVVQAFVWAKIAPEFPIVLTSQADGQVSFRIFDSVYSVTNLKKNYQIVKTTYSQGLRIGEEVVRLDSMLVEKLLKFSRAQKRSSAVLSPDAFHASIQTTVPADGFQVSQTLYQCKSDLPSRITRDGSVVNEILQHTWIQNGSQESFGMPNTDEAGYFGGLAHIRTPDSFINRGPKHLECAPVLIPNDQNAAAVSARAVCLARRLSLSQNPAFDESQNAQNWVANLDYHALDRNCLMATRFVLECAGAKAPQIPNAGIGGRVDWDQKYSVSEVPAELKLRTKKLQSQLAQMRSVESILNLPKDADALVNEAIEVEDLIRGAKGTPAPKTLLEICQLALQDC